ncbi:S8 family serine peptidase [Clostridium omnivorum]|uniref:Peptidase S8/S53 domain-containing protein n=1 Tax=Clostridium omnivorum TaxID=1604902 RepID=A0ABQ5N3C1_9CLOT|nr:S8 family serine peptidase [Clostridium sp. E14]GLC29702.1 hypothetical protein bsdE14_11120 [Clostridium sp. E14]
MGKFEKFLSIVLTYIFVVSIILQAVPVSAKAEGENKVSKGLRAIEGQVVFKVRDLKYKGYSKAVEEYKGQIISNNGPYFVVKVDSNNTKALISALEDDKNIAFAEVNAVGEKQGTVINDPMMDKQDYLSAGNVREAWDLIQNTTTEIQVAVVDSGVKANHEDLANKVLSGYNYVAGNADTADDIGHGTQVAGIIAANANNGIGIAGVAGNINTKIVPIKVIDAKGNCTSANVAAGIRYAADKNIPIINLSISGEGYSKVVEDAVNYALSKNCLVVAASGDKRDNADNYWPANIEGTLVVSCAGYGYNQSNYGKAITMSAVGYGYTTNSNGSYCNVQGSSFAAAVVSGTAALAKAKNTQYSKDQLLNLLKKSANLVGNFVSNDYASYNHYAGYGTVNALKMCNTANDYIEIASPKSGEPLSGDVEVKVKALNPSDMLKLEITLNDDPTIINTVNGSGANTYTASISALKFKEGENKITVKAYSKASNNTFIDYRYVRITNNSSNKLMVNLTGMDGTTKIQNGTRVYLSSGDKPYQTISALTDNNGAVTFFNIDANQEYNLYYYYNAGTDTLKKPVFYHKIIKGSGTMNLSAKDIGLRPVTINTKKVDNSALLNSKLNVYFINSSFELDNVFDASGNAAIYVNDSTNAAFKIVNETEGYIYEKKVEDFTGINAINFTVNDDMAAVKVNNEYSSSLSKELFSVTDKGTFQFFSKVAFELNNKQDKTVYMPKGTYNYAYTVEAKDINGNPWTYKYQDKAVNIIENTSFNYGKLQLSAESILNADKNDLVQVNTKLTDNYGNIVSFGEDSQKVFDSYLTGTKVYNSSGTLISNSSYSARVLDNRYYQGIISIGVRANTNFAAGNYFVEVSTNLGPLGTVTSNRLSFNLDGSGITVGELKAVVKPPVAVTSNVNVEYVIYNKDTNQKITGGFIEDKRPEEEISFKINKEFANSSNKIMIIGRASDGTKFLYDRPIVSSNGTDVCFDNSENLARRITFGIDDVNKTDILYGAAFEIRPSQANTILINKGEIDAKGLSKTWIDDNTYKIELFNYEKKFILGGNYNISSANTNIVFNTTSLSKFNLKVSNVNDYKCSDVCIGEKVLTGGYQFYEPRFTLNVTDSDVINVSLELNLRIIGVNTYTYNEIRGEAYNYNYEYNYDLNMPVQKNVELKDFNLEADSYNNRVLLPQPITVNYTIKSGEFILRNISRSSHYKFMNEFGDSIPVMYMNLYDSQGNVVSSNIRDKNEQDYVGHDVINDVSIPQGAYNLKIMMPPNAKMLNNNNMTVNIDASNMQKMRIMNPFDITKPLINGEVNVSGTKYYTNNNGDVYLQKGLYNKSITITANNGSEVAVFSPDNISNDNEVTIAKPISSLKKVNIKESSTLGKVDLREGNIELRNSYNNSSIFKLGKSGEVITYVDADKYTIIASSNSDNPIGYYLKTNLDASVQSQVIIDNVNLATILTENNIAANIDYQNVAITNGFLVSLGTQINYNYYDSIYTSGSRVMLCYSGTINCDKAAQYTIKFGKTFTANASLLNSQVEPNGLVSANLYFKDEFNNNVYINGSQKIKAIISQNGVDKYTLDCNNGPRGNSFNLPDGINGTVQVRYEIDLSSISMGKYTTNTVDLVCNLDNYYCVAILDPMGKPSKGGYIEGPFENVHQITIGSNGNVYIRKDTVVQGQNYRIKVYGYTQDSGEPFVYTRDYNTTIQSIASEGNSQRVNISIIKPDNITFDSGTINILKKGSFGETVYTSILQFNSTNWDKVNIWLEKGDYAIYNNMSIYNQKQYLSFADISVDQAVINSVILDGNKVSRVQVDGTTNYTLNFTGYENMWINKGELYMTYGKQFNYSLYDNNNSINYTGSLNIQPNIVNYIKAGKNFTVTPSLINTQTTPGSTVEANFAFKDEYNNVASVNNINNVKAVISDAVNTIATVDCSYNWGKAAFNLPSEAVGQLKVSFEVTVNNIGTFKSSSCDLNISMDGYYKINITDPQGMPANGGNVAVTYNDSFGGQIASASISSSGIAYVKKDNIKIGTSYKICVSGKTLQTNGLFVYIRDFSIPDVTSKETSIAAGNNISKVNISTNKPYSAIESGKFYILKGERRICSIDYSKYVTSDISNFENFNVWIDNGAYKFKMILNCNDGSTNISSYNLFSDLIDVSKASNIVMDCNNVSELKVSLPDKASLNAVYLQDGTMGFSDPVQLYNKTYFSKRAYSSVNVYYRNEAGSNINAYKKDFLIKDNVTELVVGRINTAQGASIDMPFKFPGSLKAGAQYYYSMPSIKDFNGFELNSSSQNSNKCTLNLYKLDGTLAGSIASTDTNSIIIPTLEDGIYEAEVTRTIDGVGTCKSQKQKVSIYSGNYYAFYLNNSVKSNGSISLFDGDKNIITASLSNNNINDGDSTLCISKNLLQAGKKYSALVSYCDFNNVFHSYKADITIDQNSIYQVSDPQDSVQTVITNLPTEGTKLFIDGNIIDKGVISSNGELTVKLQTGSHKINLSGYNKSNDKYYVINRTISIASDTTKIALDISNVCGISIGSMLKRNPYETTYKLNNLSTCSQFEVKYSEVPGNIVYVDKGNYDADVELRLSSSKDPITATYKLDCNGDNSNLIIGKSLKPMVNLNKIIYNTSDAVGITSVNIYDGDVELKGFAPLNFTIDSIDIMHGDKVIKSLPNIISTKLSGETNIRVKLTNEILGSIVSDTKSVIIANPTFTALGDINLDDTVDIFDLVLLSKDYGKKKGVNSDWDGRCNLDNSDNANLIDIKDLAKAAQNYNKKY